MSSLEPLSTKLTHIRHLIAAGDKDAALNLLNEFLRDHQEAEAHGMRLRLLAEELKDVSSLQESWDWLERHEPGSDLVMELGSLVRANLLVRVDQLRAAIADAGGSGQLAELDELLPLADRFPALHLVHALALMDAAKATQDANSAPRFSFDRALPSAQGRSAARKHKPEELAKQAEHACERAIALLPTSDPLHHEALVAMGRLYEDVFVDLRIALSWYHRARDLGAAVDEKISSVEQTIVKETLARFVQHLDALLDHGHFDKSAQLLNACGDLTRIAAVQARQADYFLLTGDLNRAEAAYTALLASDGREVAFTNREVRRVMGLIDQLPREILSVRGAAESLLPHSRYEVDHTNLVRRAQAGLLGVYRRQGRAEKLHDMITGLLSQSGLSAETRAVLLDDLNQAEASGHWLAYRDLKVQMDARWQAKDWNGVVDACRQLMMLPVAQPVDYAWLAAAMHRSGWAHTAVLHVLGQVTPAAMTALPGSIARALVRDLAQHGYWSVTDLYADVLPNVGGWHTRYRVRRALFVDQTLSAAQDALEAGEPEAAWAAVERVLALEPEQAHARLLACRIHIGMQRLAAARKGLLELVGDEDVGQDAVLALAEIDIIQGYLVDAGKRLQALTIDPTDVRMHDLMRSLEHRIQRTPFVVVQALDTVVSPDRLRRAPLKEKSWSATFAIRLTGVRAVRQPPPVDQRCAELLTALSQISDQLGLQCLFAWRYIGHRGTLRIALLCRVEGAISEENAHLAAQSLWDTLKSLLPLQDEQVYAYEPVMSRNELENLRLPAQVDSAVEIVRKESLILVSEDDVYMMYPFAYHEGSLDRLLRALADQPETTVLDLHFQPTVLLPWERSAIKRMLEVEADGPLLSGPGERGDERIQQAQYLFPEFLRHTQWMAFVVRIHLAARGKLNTALPNIAATSLFGPSRYEFVPANFERDLEIIQTNLRDVSAEIWGYSAAPSKLERLRYLLMPGETLTATRIPAPGPNGLPGFPALKIKATPLPSNLPQSGVVLGESVTPVRGRPVTIHATIADRMRHMYVVGRTGTGKSTLLQNMALQDIEEGRGVGIVDPHGDLVEAILERIPAHRMHDVVLFDPSDTQRPIGLNVLDVEGTFEKNMVVAEFIGLMYSMFDPHKIGIVGPRFENAVRNAMLTAMEIPGSTLVEVVRILSDRNYLRDCLEVVRDPVVTSYWKDIVGNMSDFHRSEVLDYITSKFGRFVTDHLVRNIIGQSRNALDFSGIMDRGQILLVNLAKGKIGPQNSHFLGLLLVPRLLIAALSRARMDASERRLFCLYVDEFHNFTTPAFSVMLSEARKYSLSLTVANQFISQLDEAIREAVFGNVGSLLTFQIGVKDAHYLAPEMYPVFDIDDMVNLPNYHLLAKMLIHGSAAPQFPVRTLPDTRVPDQPLADTIRRFSRQRYGRDAIIVGHEIQQRFDQSPKERAKNAKADDFLKAVLDKP